MSEPEAQRNPPDVDELRAWIEVQIVRAFGVTDEHWLSRLLALPVRPAARRVSQIAVEMDAAVREDGVCEGLKRILPYFVRDEAIVGAERVPQSGPLILAANHPGGMDSLAISSFSGRNDIKVLSGEIEFLMRLPHVREHLIIVANDRKQRMLALREGIEHLRQGGALLLYGSGTIDPDPNLFANAEEFLENWSNSVELFTRKVPQTRVLPVISSGVIAPRFMFSPLSRVRRHRIDRQRLAEFLQAMSMLFIRRNRFGMKISFGVPMDLGASTSARDELLAAARVLLAEHLWDFPPAHQKRWPERRAPYQAEE
ncbi:MAG: 1-acyl-sn-glycerol-3-phosphate acyltransferase [Anaerolineaceae bacterium]|nr:1-acyl-sn-glycerol-3-phosphate acyltransferase [Anaerolineaceae bacterium]